MDAIFNFTKPTDGSTVASNRIANFLAKELKLPLFWDGEVAKEKLDTLIIVNGAFAFCDCLPALGVAIEFAKRIIWVQQDYTIVPPKAESNANSPFRKAFRERRAAGLPDMDWWTTIKSNSALTPRSDYVNWNSLTYTPLDDDLRKKWRSGARQDVFYYGAFRIGRASAFDRYFTKDCPVPITIYSTSKKFRERYEGAANGQIEFGEKIVDFAPTLCKHGLGLYIEDDKSHVQFHSPANRFYEMLGAGLPMVFQPECRIMLKEAGIDVPDAHVASAPWDFPKLMRRRAEIGAQQRELWHANYRQQLTRRVRTLWAKYKRGE
jgi:hypothetical protein